MATASLMSIPAEIRLSIFRQLFIGSEVTICSWYHRVGRCRQVAQHQLPLNIFYSCKQAYQEARPVLGTCVKLTFEDTTLAEVPSTIKAFYFPLIWHITVDGLDTSITDLTVFTNLRQLTFTHNYDPKELGYYELQETLSGEKAVTSLLEGALDQKIMNTAKDALLANGFSWHVEAYNKPGRSFEMIDTLQVDWDHGAGKNHGFGSLRMAYNLDTMEVCERSAKCEFRPAGLEKIWEDGWAKTWKLLKSGRVCIGNVPWRQDSPPTGNDELDKVTLVSM